MQPTTMSADAAGQAENPGGMPTETALNLLLVCSDPAWSKAVQEVTNSVAVQSFDTRSAIVRLAGTSVNFSHLLLQDRRDDGLFDALFQLSSEAAGTETEILLLGGNEVGQRPQNVTRIAHSGSVQEALMVGPRRRGPSDVEMKLDELRDALDRSLITTRYQPIVRMADRQPVALEVLARLDHPVRGTVLPDRFVPQIEDAGLAERLTDVVAERAFTDLAAAGLTRHGFLITVNFPLDVLLKTEAIARLDAHRTAAGIPADMVVVELTESIPVKDFDALRRVLEQVRSRGYRVAIDDVGPAVPGLDDLLELPFTSLKLDMDLVIRSGEDPAVLAFLRGTTDRAHRKGMQVIAEGVETIEAWKRMEAIGVDGAQGFLVARPLPAAAVDVWLDAWRRTPPFV